MDYKETREIYLRLYTDAGLCAAQKTDLYNQYLKNIKTLAHQGDADAQYDLAQHYEDTGYFGIPNPFFNSFRRFYWYCKAAKNNNGAACNNLGYMIELGEGCKIDFEKALEYYKKSSELGDALGQKNYLKMLKDLKKGGMYNL
jgi:TPR repeat protein